MRTQDAISHFGSQAALARALNITRSAVNQWGDLVPRSSAYELEVITGGVLKVDRDAYACVTRETEAGHQATHP